MNSTKNRLRQLESVNQRREVRLTSMQYDPADTATQTVIFRCDDYDFEIARAKGEGTQEFACRAEAEGMALAQAHYPKAIILAPGAEDL